MVQSPPLTHQVALVTGASRGVGLGIARVLGRSGALVYVTARTSSDHPADVPLPGTIDATAAAIRDEGGRCVAIQCDHSDDEQVRRAVEHVLSASGRIDILVNNAWAGYQEIQRHGEDHFEDSFWELPLEHWDSMFQVGVRSHYIASALVAPSMVKRRSGLIVNISYYAGASYRFNVAYGVAKGAVDRMSADMAVELKMFDVASISLWPGTVKTEMNLLQSAQDLSCAETPEFVGMCVKALATDPEIMAMTGTALETRRLALKYGFSEADGSVPPLDRGL